MTFELAHTSPVRSSARARDVTGRKLTGQKPALKMKEGMAIRIHLKMAGKIRELALFSLGMDSQLRGRDLVRLRVEDVAVAGTVKNRAAIVQKKTERPVQFEITNHAWAAVGDLIEKHGLSGTACRVLTSCFTAAPHIQSNCRPGDMQLVQVWVSSIGLHLAIQGAHSLRRTQLPGKADLDFCERSGHALRHRPQKALRAARRRISEGVEAGGEDPYRCRNRRRLFRFLAVFPAGLMFTRAHFFSNASSSVSSSASPATASPRAARARNRNSVSNSATACVANSSKSLFTLTPRCAASALRRSC